MTAVPRTFATVNFSLCTSTSLFCFIGNSVFAFYLLYDELNILKIFWTKHLHTFFHILINLLYLALKKQEERWQQSQLW